MEYTLGKKQKNNKILIELLQNKFTKFNVSIVKWKFRNGNINSSFLEEKLLYNIMAHDMNQFFENIKK